MARQVETGQLTRAAGVAYNVEKRFSHDEDFTNPSTPITPVPDEEDEFVKRCNYS